MQAEQFARPERFGLKRVRAALEDQYARASGDDQPACRGPIAFRKHLRLGAKRCGEQAAAKAAISVSVAPVNGGVRVRRAAIWL